MRSLDEFNRYIDKKTNGSRTPEVEDRTTPASEADGLSAGGVRYVLRGGITIAMPAAKEDAPGNDVVAEETALSRAGEVPAAAEAPVLLPSTPTVGERDAALWQRLPRHIQLLMRLADTQEEEAAQKYYTRGFKESRGQLIARLLDPTLTLEDTARVLGVVPATVRRYTNRGVLPHHRTVGQQRRFRLSDVLAFLEAQQAGRIPEPGSEPDGDSDA